MQQLLTEAVAAPMQWPEAISNIGIAFAFAFSVVGVIYVIFKW